MTSKEALENLCQTNSANIKMYEYEYYYKIIKNDLEVFEIIKRKPLQFYLLTKSSNYHDYLVLNEMHKGSDIFTEDAFNRIKEVISR